MEPLIRKRLTLLLACLCLASLVAAASARAQVKGQDGMLGVDYMTGGISEEERSAMDAAAAGYDLKLVFINSDRAYLSNVRVSIERQDDHEVMLQVVTTGPWLYVSLPGGSYEVTAAVGDVDQSIAVDVTPGAVNTQYMLFQD